MWYFGLSSRRYFLKKPGLVYEVLCDGEVVLASSKATPSLKSVAYESGEHIHKISPQLSYSFKYNSIIEDNWLSGEITGFLDSVIIQEKKEFYIRPINRHVLKPVVKGEIIKNARDGFFNPETGTFFVADVNEKPTELAHSFAILSGIADESLSKKLVKRLADNEFLPCSFSMKCFKYDALLIVDGAYKDVILEEIRGAYKNMVDAGSTTVWETAKGAEDFDHAGSLCHGWRAIPIYYYYKFFGQE